MARTGEACAPRQALTESARASRPALVLGALLLVDSLSRAQTTGSIEGRLRDTNGETLAGVPVSAASPSLQGTRTAVSDVFGLFRLPVLPPGEYTVRAAVPGFRVVEKLATVSLDGTARADFVLEPQWTEEVRVSGAPTALDPRSTTTGTKYTSQVILRLPVARNYADIVRSNPGVSTDTGETQGRSLALAIYGATSAENQWIVDGVNTTNVFKGIQGKSFNNEFVQEVEVKTGGYEPEYGRALGGVVNVITKSGGNDFHGDGFVYYDSADMVAERKHEPGDLVSVSEMRALNGLRLDYGVGLGGYILKDRLWVFGSFNRVESREDLSRVESSTYVSSDEIFPLDVVENHYSGKLTWNASSSTTLVGTVFADPFTRSGVEGGAPVSPDPSTWWSDRKQGGADFGLRLNQLFGPRVLAAIQGSYHQDKYMLTAPDGVRTEDWTCEGGMTEKPCEPPPEANNITGGFGWISAMPDRSASRRPQFRGQATLYEGTHEIKAGGDYSDGRTEATGQWTGGQGVGILNEYGQLYYVHRFVAVSPENPTPVPQWYRKARVRDFGAYLQDSWKAASGLTINAGVRWDGEDIDNYAGETVLRLRTAWQPRIGVVWDPWRDGATKVYAFAGRFSWAMPTAQAAEMFANLNGVDTFNFDPVSVVHDPNVLNHSDPDWLIQGPFGSPVDSGVVSPYQDELTVGVERTLGSSLTVGLKGTYRRLGATIETRCDLDPIEENDYSGCAIITPGSSGKFARGDVATCNGLDDPWGACGSTGPATPEAKRAYRGIELLARQSVGDRFWLQASYAYSSLRGNYDGGFNQMNFGHIPGANSDFDGAAGWQNSYGKLSLDRPHHFGLDGYWVSPWRLAVGLQAFAESGAPLNKMGYAGVFIVPRGSAGRLPTVWDADLTLTYPVTTGPVTATLQAYLYNLFDNQIAVSKDESWSIFPPEGYPYTMFDPKQAQTNSTYGAVTGRSDPRSFRAAVKVSF